MVAAVVDNGDNSEAKKDVKPPKIIMAHRIQLLPCNKHRTFFKKAAGISRFCYNWALAEWERQYKLDEKPSVFGLKKQFNGVLKKGEFPWVNEVNSHTKQQAFADVGKAFKHFFRRVKQGETPGYPKFKKKGKCRDSFYMANIEFTVDGRYVNLPKKMGRVRLREKLRYPGKIMGATLSREVNRWYISIQVEMNPPKPRCFSESQAELIGIHLGVKHLAVLSTGDKIEGPKAYVNSLKRLKRLQRQLRPGKRERGSTRYKAYQRKLATRHRRIVRLRHNALHQLSAQLTKNHAIICIRDLDVKKMTQSARGTKKNPGKNVKTKAVLNRSILDMGWHEFKRQLEYKAALTGTTVSIIDSSASTSKPCSRCGAVNDSVSLAKTEYHCHHCGLVIDRRINSAINICTLGARGIDARGDNGSVNDNAVH